MDKKLQAQEKDGSNKKVVTMLVAMAFFMTGFGFALVPLYDVFCEVTGLNGKTADGPAVVNAVKVDESRLVTVQFVASLNKDAPWKFRPAVFEMKVHPGQLMETSFYAENLTDKDKVAQAVPSVTPGLAASHFNKTECFCFTQQAFKPGEGKNMPLRFMLNPELPEEIHTVTLSYTFFELDKVAAK